MIFAVLTVGFATGSDAVVDVVDVEPSGAAVSATDGAAIEAIVVCPSRILSSRAESCVPSIWVWPVCEVTSAFTLAISSCSFAIEE